MSDQSDTVAYLKSISENIAILKSQIGKIVNSMVAAEAEVPESMRRFVMYMHDIHDIKNLYDEHGLGVPQHVLREVERCDDRLRQLLEQLHLDGGAFEKVRREMAKDPTNRWDHTRQLSAPGETK